MLINAAMVFTSIVSISRRERYSATGLTYGTVQAVL